MLRETNHIRYGMFALAGAAASSARVTNTDKGHFLGRILLEGV